MILQLAYFSDIVNDKGRCRETQQKENYSGHTVVDTYCVGIGDCMATSVLQPEIDYHKAVVECMRKNREAQ